MRANSQREDENLASAWKLACQNKADYTIKDELLYHTEKRGGQTNNAADVILNWRMMIRILVHVIRRNALLCLPCGGRPWLLTFSDG